MTRFGLRTLRSTAWLFLLLVATASVVFAQTAPTPPVPPVPPVPQAPSDSGTATAVIAVPGARVIYHAGTDSLRQQIKEIRAKIAVIKQEGNHEELAELDRQLQEAYRELARQRIDIVGGVGNLGKLDLDLPNIQLPRTIVDADGNTHIIIGSTKPRHHKSGDQVGVFSNVTVDEDEYVDQSAVAIFGDVHVDGHVEKEAVAIFGSVYISGSVGGDVAAPFGDVHVENGAEVDGDITAVNVIADDLSVIGGKIDEVQLPRLSWMPGANGARSIYLMIATALVTKAALSVLFGFLLLGLVPRHVNVVEQRIRICPFRCFFWGMLFQLLILPVAAILVVTVIGIPVALLGLPLLIVIALLFGFVAIARMLGTALIAPGDPGGRRMVQFLIGAMIIHLPFLIGLAMWAMPSEASQGPESFLANILIWAGLSILYVVSTLGFGAAIMSRFGTRPYFRAPRPTPGAPVRPADMPPPPGTSGPTPMPAPPSGS